MAAVKALAAVVLVFASALAAWGQGTLRFSNAPNGVSGPNAPVHESDGVTKCSGPQFMADLLAGPSADSLSLIASTGFLTGNGAGYFFGGTATVNTVAGGATAWVQVDVWNTSSGASFQAAKVSGMPNSWWQSAIFTAVTGWTSINPAPPGSLDALGKSPVYLNSVPEPSALALAGLGALLVLRKRLTSQGTE